MVKLRRNKGTKTESQNADYPSPSPAQKGDAGEEGVPAPNARIAQPEGSSNWALDEQFSELYRANAASLFRYGLLLTHNVSLAQDAVQETFLKYYLQRLRGELEQERPWLFRVLRNYILDQQKSMGSKMSVDLEAARNCEDAGQSPQRALEASEAMRLVYKVLSPREVQCLQLRAEGFSYKEIAEILAIEPGTVGSLLARSSEKIRKALGEEGLPCEAI